MKVGVINIALANPRGFCAGVERAIIIVEEALKNMGLLFTSEMKLFTISMSSMTLNKRGQYLLMTFIQFLLEAT